MITVSGRMVFGDSLLQIRSQVQEALASGIRRFIIDISDVPYLDSSACGELISVHTSIARVQGALAVVNPQEGVWRLLTRIRLNAVLNIVRTLEQTHEP